MPSNLLLNEENCPYWEDGENEVRIVVNYDETPMWEYVGVSTEGDSTLNVERSVDGDTWEPVIESRVGGTLEDFQGLSNGETLYRGSIATSIGTAANTVVSVIADSQAVWIGGGTDWAAPARLPFDPELTISAGRERSSVHYAEEPMPTAYAGLGVTRKYSVGGRILCGEDANTAAQILQGIAEKSEPLILYRDPLGHRAWGTIGAISLPYLLWGAWQWSLELTETKGPYDV